MKENMKRVGVREEGCWREGGFIGWMNLKQAEEKKNTLLKDVFLFSFKNLLFGGE